MKRFLEIVSISAVLLLAFSFVSCKNGNGDSGDDGDTGMPALSWEEIKELDTNPLESILQLAPDYHDKSKSVVVPKGFTSIRKGVFTESEYLEEIEIPASVLYIEDSTFSGCSNLKSIKFAKGSKLQKIDGAFRSCGIETISLPSGIKEIGAGAFNACHIKTIDLPSGIKTIGESAFRYSHLEKIELPKGVTKISDNAFTECKSLEEIKLSENLKEIGKEAFLFSGIKNITIPASVEKMGANVFSDWRDPPTNYSVKSKLKSVEFVKGSKMEKLDGAVFEYCTVLETVVLPSSLKEIGYKTFYRCEKLKAISFPESLEKIGSEAFNDCVLLEEIILPNGLQEIESYAFGYCIAVKKVVLPNSLKSVNGFNNCRALETITIPSGVEKVGGFDGCGSLKTVNLPDGLQELLGYAFRGCGSLKTINLPKGLKIIRQECFASCSGLESITIPASVEEIGDSAFSLYPTSPSSRPTKGFEIKFEENSNLKSIGQYAFTSSNGKDITIPASVETIGTKIFGYTEIYDYSDAAQYYYNITFLSTEPPTIKGGDLGGYTNLQQNIYVPAASVDEYKTKWSGYASKIKPISE